MAIIIAVINGVRGDKLHFNYNSRRKQYQNEVFICQTTTYVPIQCSYFTNHTVQTFQERTEDLVPGYPTAQDTQKGTVHGRAKRSVPNTGTNPKLEGTKTTINVNEGATNTKCFKRTNLKCCMRKCLKILGGDPLQIAGKRPTIFTPTCHLKCPLLIQSTRHKQTSHLHPFTLHSFMSLIFHLTQPQERKQTNLTFVSF